ncbi:MULTISPECIES: TonB-dependent receptor [Pseudoalteromonas]|uniref:TonB-dependent receptor n=1 Tax=Pseudoalteromonas amylolytica TaxID=1859457 RepID=A0A1S1MVF2_9GAMM|nr:MULTISPECIES: TonB-dependent receptor [Pseudoalteromonas]OHU86528.1 TonB-dependent receptor [Pseudoalteromonas sp. JW3]OHU88948.1 TonB-dependent receptor [Pseudoalteromonas amylolytica]
MNNNKLLKRSLISTAIFSSLSMMPTIATADVGANEDQQSLEVITVTSRKKVETILEIPMSVSAISAAEMSNRNYLDASDIYRTLAGAAAPRGELILRGLSGGNDTTPDTTAIFTDDIPYEFTNLADIERVEILRGPQGTLYGSNAIGGTVRVITNKPRLDEFELFGTMQGAAEKDVDGYDSSMSLGVNIPLISNTLAMRVNGNITNDMGPMVNKATGVQREEKTSFLRTQLLWQPQDGTTINFAYVRDERNPQGTTLGDTSKPGGYFSLDYKDNPTAKYGYDVSHSWNECNPNWGRVRCVQGSEFVTGAIDKYSVYNTFDYWEEEQFDLFSVAVNIDNIADIASLSYTGSYREYETHYLDDWSRLDAADMFKTWIITHDEEERTTHELRLQNLDANSPLSWTVGFFYDKTEEPNTPDYQWQYLELGDKVSAAAEYWWGVDARQMGIDKFSDPAKIWNLRRYSAWDEEQALFADVSYTFQTQELGEFELNAGVRRFDLEDYSHTETEGVWSESVTLTSGKEDGNRYKLSASWRPEKHYSVYALYSEGYRPGGNNGPLAQACVNDPKAGNRKDRYTSDAIDNYELGVKASLFDGRFSFSSAIYNIDWTDIKTDIYMDTCGFSYTANAGAARSRGLEFESTANLTDDLSLIVNASYTKSELTEDNASIGGSKGDEMALVPKYNAYIALDQEFEFRGRPAFIRADVSAYGKYKTHFNTKDGDNVPAYQVFNLSARYEVNDNVKLSLHLNNVFDKETVKYQNDRSRSDSATAQKYIEFLPGRTLAVRLDYIFF